MLHVVHLLQDVVHVVFVLLDFVVIRLSSFASLGIGHLLISVSLRLEVLHLLLIVIDVIRTEGILHSLFQSLVRLFKRIYGLLLFLYLAVGSCRGQVAHYHTQGGYTGDYGGNGEDNRVGFQKGKHRIDEHEGSTDHSKTGGDTLQYRLTVGHFVKVQNIRNRTYY